MDRKDDRRKNLHVIDKDFSMIRKKEEREKSS